MNNEVVHHIWMEDIPLHPFLFMGCWNQPGKARDAVLASLEKRKETLLILGGDNIYPIKTKQNNRTAKIYNKNIIDDGLSKINKKVYACLGNHNWKDPTVRNYELSLSWMPHEYYCIVFSDKYAIVVLNTNNLQHTEMYVWLTSVLYLLKTEGIQYYLIQHDPYISFKRDKITTITVLHTVLSILSAYLPVAVLCADTHNYQYGLITYPDRSTQVHQYVVGTGGATYDMIENGSLSTIQELYNYKLEQHIPGYGYLIVNKDSIQFKKVKNWEIVGGRTRRKYRN